MYKEIFYDRQFRTWVGRYTNLKGDQIGDCEYFGNKQLAQAWKNSVKFEPLRNGSPMYYESEGGSMCNGIGREYF